MANYWTLSTGTKLTTLEEGVETSVALPLSEPSASVKLISGSLPAGMLLSGTNIIGTPYEVVRNTDYTFVLRATYDNKISDRTFIIEVQGPDAPTWVTPAGDLPIGQRDQIYILDSSLIDYQLVVEDLDVPVGQTLEFFIDKGDGELPPGIQLTTDGRLVGIVEPLLSLERYLDPQNFDKVGYDSIPYDFGQYMQNGFDSFFYDTVPYDHSEPTRSPKKLNRQYKFVVSVTDGDTTAKRQFSIFVIGDDFVRSDTTLMKTGNGVFTADVTHIRTPVWLTPRDLGYRRAKNYVTLMLDVLDTNELLGQIVYSLESVNDDGSVSVLPPGVKLDPTTGEIAGSVPYQPSTTQEYKFSVRATRYGVVNEKQDLTLEVYEDAPINSHSIKVIKSLDTSLLVGRKLTIGNDLFTITSVDKTESSTYDVLYLGENVIVTAWENGLPSETTISIRKLGPETLSQLIGLDISWGSNTYTIDSVDDNTRVYRSKTVHTSSSLFAGDVDTYWEEVTGYDLSLIDKSSLNVWMSDNNYNLSELVKYNPSEFEYITFTTPITQTIYAGSNTTLTLVELYTNDVVSQGTNYTFSFSDDIYLEGVSSVKTFIVKTIGDVDSRLIWNSNSNLGTLITNYDYRLNIDAVSNVPNSYLLFKITSGSLPPGLTMAFDGTIHGTIKKFSNEKRKGVTLFDGVTTTFDATFDRSYRFTVSVQDQYKLSVEEREFYIIVDDSEDTRYSNLYARPMLRQQDRDRYNELINDPDVFLTKYLYRPNDPTYGLQLYPQFLVYAGIETKETNQYVAAMAKNHKRRSYKIGKVRTAVAKLPGTNDVVYEVVYLDVIDPAGAKKGQSTAKQIKIKNAAKLITNQSDTGDERNFYAVVRIVLRSGAIITTSSNISQYTVELRGALGSARGNDVIINEPIVSVTLRNGEIIELAPSDIQIQNTEDASPWYLRSIDSNELRVDSDAVEGSQEYDRTRYISNLKNMRDNIKDIGLTNREFLPLWMRTPQKDNYPELGYTPAIPLCYCKPGTAEIIARAIEYKQLDFSGINMDIDRFIIDSTFDGSDQKYLLMANYQFNV